ncbi:tyrosine-protein kinase ITK/TSK [Eucyclogobius newberryi]|uniref:tyrosine-protein kinase ITK/TSK n=1 Tax=Eucyclogobius newberryi TaxID=166745 RepID=UPI003B5A3947
MYPRVILNGKLIKKSQQKKITSPENYRERLFVLDTKELKYSDCRPGRKDVLKGSVELWKIKCVETVDTDFPIPCNNKYPFQIFYENYYLYIFAPDNNTRLQWVKALKEETQYNQCVPTYHPNMWREGKWRCCKQTAKLAVGCAKYDPVTLACSKPVPPVPNPKRKQTRTDAREVIAIQDFTPVEEGDLQIQKEQKYILLDDSDVDRWLVQDSEGNAGLVPSTYVAGKFETNFDRFEWYDDDIGSEEATQLLSKEAKEGAFMVRRSSKAGQYSVSVYASALGSIAENKPNVRHYLIRQKSKSEAPFYVAEKKSFFTIPELVHYHQHNCAGMVTRLKQPVSRPRSSSRRPSIAPIDLEVQWQMDPLELTLEGKLGDGQFGLVMGGTWRDKKVAVKMIKEGAMSEAEFKEEAKVMMKLSHCKLVQLYGVCTQRSPMCMVFEFMEQGALLDYLRARRGNLSQDTLLEMCLDVCEGMNYLDCSNYLHRDLAARNCLVSHDNVVKVADFGMARFVLDNDYTSSQGAKFPIRWSAPEVIRYSKYTSKSDVWSFGVLMWEVYSEGLLPYEKQKNMHVVNSVNKGQRLSQPTLAPDDVHVLMNWCWKEKPEDRPTFGQLLHQLGCLTNV